MYKREYESPRHLILPPVRYSDFYFSMDHPMYVAPKSDHYQNAIHQYNGLFMAYYSAELAALG